MSSVARNHHWIPQCYLKGFAKNRSKTALLHVVDAVAQRQFSTVPRNVAAARDFNRIDVDGFCPNHVEASLANFEGAVAKALERICAARAIRDPGDFNLLLNLMALLAVRNPGMRESRRSTEEQSTKAFVINVLASEQGFDAALAAAIRDGALSGEDRLTYREMRDFVDNDRYIIDVPTTQHVEHELELVDTILPLLGRRRWLILRANPDAGSLITSDHPVILQWIDQPKDNRFAPPGFGLRNTEVIFPVSQGLAMIGTFDESGGTIDAGQRQVELINGVIIAHGMRQIYSRDDQFRYVGRDGRVRLGTDALHDLPRPAPSRAES
jgi:hypothetical protein